MINANVLEVSKIPKNNNPTLNIYDEVMLSEAEILNNKTKNAFVALNDLREKYDL